MRCLAFVIVIVTLASLHADERPRSPREALQPFNDLIGSWRGTATPVGSRAEVQQNFWVETLAWSWQFKGKDAWLEAQFDKSKHFKSGTLRYRPERDDYSLQVITVAGDKHEYAGRLAKRDLTLERDTKEETQRLVFTLLHSNRFLYRYETRPAGKTLFARKYQVGATKEGVPFATGSGQPECIVSGGLGTTPVMFEGKTYYVCCSGCRAEFQENAAQYVRDYETKKRK
jgi:hypothetical protein